MQTSLVPILDSVGSPGLFLRSSRCLLAVNYGPRGRVYMVIVNAGYRHLARLHCGIVHSGCIRVREVSSLDSVLRPVAPFEASIGDFKESWLRN